MADYRQSLVEQLYNPVRWIDTIELFQRHGVKRVVECGPGKVLAGLGKRIAPGIDYVAFYDELSKDATTLVVNEDETRAVDLKLVTGGQ